MQVHGRDTEWTDRDPVRGSVHSSLQRRCVRTPGESACAVVRSSDRPVAATAATGAALTAIAASPGVSSAKAAEPLYLSMGDSYSVGYQNPTLGNTTGFTGYVAGQEHLQLENFGCGGATTTSLFTQISCPPGGRSGHRRGGLPDHHQVDAVLALPSASRPTSARSPS